MKKSIEAKNLSAQLQYRAAGNPPSSLPGTAISNAFPGLELDFRNVWKLILRGIELHESSNFVVAVDPDAPAEVQVLAPPKDGTAGGYRLMQIEEISMMVDVKGPREGAGPDVVLLADAFEETKMPLEWSNALAEVVQKFSGQPVCCTFESLPDPKKTVQLSLVVRPFFEEVQIDGETLRLAVIAREAAPPGALTQSLCSPWQNDYRECACFYWAATRPDYVNVEARPDGTSSGNNWMQKDRTPETPNLYIVDDWMDPSLVSYTDLFRHWETSLRFVIGGTDEEVIPDSET